MHVPCAAEALTPRASPERNSLSGEAELLEWREFRLFLCVLKRMYELAAAFGRSGVGDGHERITLAAFKRGLHVLHGWGVTLRREEVEREFELLDASGSGTIGFDELIAWAVRRKLAEEDATHARAASATLTPRAGGATPRSAVGTPASAARLDAPSRYDYTAQPLRSPHFEAPSRAARGAAVSARAATPTHRARAPVTPGGRGYPAEAG